MRIKNKFRVNNIWIIIIVCIHWLSTFYTDKFTFYRIKSEFLIVFNYIMVKSILLLFLYIFWNTILNVKSLWHNRFKKIIFYMLPLLPVWFFAIILAWPLNIAWGDMVKIFNETTNFSCAYKYSWIISYFHIFSRMILPMVSGPMIVEGILYLVFAGYITSRLDDIFGSISKISYCFWLLLPNVFFSLYPNRVPIFAYIYLGLTAVLILDHLEKRKLTRLRLIMVLLLGTVVAYLRKECIYLIVIVPILIIITYEQKMRFIRYIQYFLSIVVIYLLLCVPHYIGTYQNSYIYSKEQTNVIYCYNLTAMLYECGIEGLIDSKEGGGAEELKVINEYLDLEIIADLIKTKGRDCLGDAYANWDSGWYAWKKDKEKDEFGEFYKVCNKIFLRNIDVFLKAKMDQFLYTALDKNIFYGWESDNTIREYYIGKLNLVDPIIPRGNKMFIYLFSHSKEVHVSYLMDFFVFFLKDIMWNLVLPIILLAINIILSIWKHDKLMIILSIMFVIHGAVVFIMSPASYFMYYFPLYLTTYFISMVYILEYIKRKTDN